MATYDTPIPGVPQYGQAALAAKTAYQNALARINQRRSGLIRDAGFQADVNPETGVVGGMRVDGSNKYGTFQLLNRSQAQRGLAARNMALERGLGAGGGLAAQMQNEARFSFGQEDADLSRRLLESLSGLQDEQNQAAYQRDAALYQAELEAARMALQERMFNEAQAARAAVESFGQGGGGSPAPAGAGPAHYPSADGAAQKAAQAALNSAKRKGLSPAEAALAARSAALNSMYNLGGSSGGGGGGAVFYVD